MSLRSRCVSVFFLLQVSQSPALAQSPVSHAFVALSVFVAPAHVLNHLLLHEFAYGCLHMFVFARHIFLMYSVVLAIHWLLSVCVSISVIPSAVCFCSWRVGVSNVSLLIAWR